MTSPDFSNLTNSRLQDFIADNEKADERKLVLRHKDIFGVPAAWVAAQISARRKAKDKLPLFYKTKGIIYPPTTNLEQSSSEVASKFKARLVVESLKGKKPNGVDLTGGFGIDSLYFSLVSEKLDYVERDLSLLEMARHNHALTARSNLQYHHSSAEDFIKATKGQFDFAFIDPSRRSRSRKVFLLKDSEPDLLPMLASIFEKTDHLLVKTSPLLDLHQGALELGQAEKIIIVSIDNECKEVLFWCTKGFAGEPAITCVNLSTQNRGMEDEFEFTFSDEKKSVSVFSDPLTYLYEPNASILKAGAFKTVGLRFNLHKLQANTHLYTSEKYLGDFPGRIFKINELQRSSKDFKRHFKDGKVNVLTRNYPLTADQLKKKFRLHDGGEKYLIGFSGPAQKFLVAAERLR